jgi:hypothetical protein
MKSKRAMLILIAVGAFGTGTASFAHHSFPATYQVEQTITIKGKVIQFMFRNPHSLLHVEAPGADGKMHRWVVEWGSAGSLDRSQVTRDLLKPGDEVIVMGNPGRIETDHKLRMNTIERPKDGWKWVGEAE